MTEQATMTDTSDARLQRLLGTPALADVRQRLRRHFERIDPGAPVIAVGSRAVMSSISSAPRRWSVKHT